MKQKLSNAVEFLKNKYLYYATMVSTALMSVRSVYCTDEETSSSSGGSAIWDVSDGSADTIFGYFCTIYRKWAWVVFVWCLFRYFLAKKPEVSGIYGKICIGIVVVYVLTFLEGIFTGTLSGLASAFTS